MDLESSCRLIMVLIPFASFFVLYRIDIIGELPATLLPHSVLLVVNIQIGGF